MTMIKCPECRHHISSMAQSCPECGAPIDPEWAEAEAQKELKKLEDVPFSVEVGGEETEDGVTEEAQPADEDTEHEDQFQEEEEPSREDVPPAPPAPKSGGGGRFLFLGIVVLIGLLIGGLYYYDYAQMQKREMRAYELLQDCSNPDFYEDFIIRFPKSKHIEEVRERYKVVAAQQNEWQKLILNGTRDELRQFVRLHPTSPYVKVAQGRIDSLDWTEAKELRSLEAVTHYMATHPDGYYIDQAETLRQTLERQRREAAAAAAAARRDSLAQLDSAQVVSV